VTSGMADFELTARAEEDLIDIWLYIAWDNPGAADRLLNEIEEKFPLLAANPELGQARPDIAEDCRHLPCDSWLHRAGINGFSRCAGR
jgi:toxin ParE1/3/4